MNKILEKINDAIEEAIKPIVNKGASMTPAELEILTKAVCTIEKIKQIEDADNYSDYSHNSYNGGNSYNSYDEGNSNAGNSYRRGRSATTGRYVSRDSAPYVSGYSSRRFYDGEHHNGYSGHSIKDRMIAQLEKMYDEAQTEHERQTVNDWIRRLDSGN